MTPDQRRDLLIRAGRTLYGERWQTPLAHDLRVNVRTMTRWASGRNRVPDWVLPELRGLLKARGAAIHALLAETETPAAS